MLVGTWEQHITKLDFFISFIEESCEFYFAILCVTWGKSAFLSTNPGHLGKQINPAWLIGTCMLRGLNL